MTVATNVASLNTQKWLNVSTTKQSSSLEELSSGSKINKASDDAAGLAISTKLNVKAVSLYKAIDNGNQAVAMLQTAEGGFSTVSDILTRLKELATEAASDNNATDRGSLQLERAKLEAQITNIAQGTKYGQTTLLSGTTVISQSGATLAAGSSANFTGVNVTAAATAGTYAITVADHTTAGAVTNITYPTGLSNLDTGTVAAGTYTIGVAANDINASASAVTGSASLAAGVVNNNAVAGSYSVSVAESGNADAAAVFDQGDITATTLTAAVSATNTASGTWDVSVTSSGGNQRSIVLTGTGASVGQDYSLDIADVTGGGTVTNATIGVTFTYSDDLAVGGTTSTLALTAETFDYDFTLDDGTNT
jgi:flagellin